MRAEQALYGLGFLSSPRIFFFFQRIQKSSGVVVWTPWRLPSEKLSIYKAVAFNTAHQNNVSTRTMRNGHFPSLAVSELRLRELKPAGTAASRPFPVRSAHRFIFLFFWNPLQSL